MALNPSTGWGYYKQITIGNPLNGCQMELWISSGNGSDTYNGSIGHIYCNTNCK